LAKHRRKDAMAANKWMKALSKTAKRISGRLVAIAPGAILAGCIAAAAASVGSATGRPLVPAERRYIPYDDVLPACDDPAVFERIQGRFHDREAEFWNTGLEILGFGKVAEIGYKTNGLDYIPRRYCTARAYLNDEKSHQVSYSINEDLGIIGFGFGVEWCVGGLDRNDAYAPNCKMARP
jgi:hypothetical protein